MQICNNPQTISNLPSPEELVGQILSREKKEGDEEKSKLYLVFENYLRERNRAPTWGVAGPLHYGMTLEKMEEVTRETFREMASNSQMMREGDLNQNHDRSAFYPPSSKKASNNLTRIWGAEFLKTKLERAKDLEAAKHYFIVEDDATEIEVEMWHTEYPVLSIVKNGYIVSDKIEGNRAASLFQFSKALDAAKFRDFSDPGNIILDRNGVGWVVDTEHKSFDRPNVSRMKFQYQDYLKKRFEVLTGKEYNSLYQTFTISLSDIGL